ncbi:MAG: hypothetical protein Q8K18_17855 [Burkholderiales bacterium]|nr:hypothetical protein [Burkholderiales bacterium]
MNRTKHTFLIAIMSAAIAMTTAGVSQSAEQQSPKPAAKKMAPPIYGSQLMTQQERDEYRARMRAAKTPEAREAVRAEHHQAMQVRAKERGVTLPDKPRTDSGPGKGPGAGMGPGTGAGPGSGMGPRRDGSGPGPR